MTTITIHSLPINKIEEFVDLIMDPKVEGLLEYKISDIIHRTDHATIAIRGVKSTIRFDVESNHSGIFIEVNLPNGYTTGFAIDPGESTGVAVYND